MAPSDFTIWERQNPISTANDVKTTFSSWDACMQKNYCKYPAIVGIVVGVLVILGIAWCIIGCMCCGYTCCKGCCSCCCPSSSGRGGRDRSKYSDPPPPPRQNPNPNFGYQPNPAPPVYAAQNSYAQFDVPRRASPPKTNEDALPAMPSWTDAKTRRIEDHSSHDVEMNRLEPNNGGAAGAVGRAGRGGYHEVPNQPTFTPDTYRGTETNTTSQFNPAAIGVARSVSPYSHQNDHHGHYDDDHLHQQHHTPNPRYSPPHAAGGTYFDGPARAHTRSPVSPTHAPSYTPYGGNNAYTPYSPTLPSTPPPPFSSVQGDNDARTPSLLQPGRKPVQNSWRDV